MTTMLTDENKWLKATQDLARWVARERRDLVDDNPADVPIDPELRLRRREYKAMQPSPVWQDMLEKAILMRKRDEAIAKQAHFLVEREREAQAQQLLIEAGYLGAIAFNQSRYLQVTESIDAIGPIMPDSSVA